MAIPVVILLGKPGSGKSLLAEGLEKRGSLCFSSGNALREARAKSNLFMAAEKTPLENMTTVMELLDDFLKRSKKNNPKSIVLDVQQPNPAGYLYISDLLRKYQLNMNLVVNLLVNNDVAKTRVVSRNRDSQDSVKRLEIYNRSGSHLLLLEAVEELPGSVLTVNTTEISSEDVCDQTEQFINELSSSSISLPIEIRIPCEPNLKVVSNFNTYKKIMHIHQRVAAGRSFAGTQVSGCLQVTPSGQLVNKQASKKESQQPNADTHLVSRKIDGTRYLLIIEEEEYYLISRHCHTAYTMRLSSNTHQYLSKDSFLVFDGELVQFHDNSFHFMIFDILAEAKGVGIMAKPLQTRLTKCLEFYPAESTSDIVSDGISISVKQYFDFNMMDKLLFEDQKSIPYPTDGIIFTPVRYYVRGADGNLIKWKPPELLTADFKLINNELYCLRDKPYALVYMSDITGLTTQQQEHLQNRIIECKVSNNGIWTYVRIRNDKDQPNLENVAAASVDNVYQITAEMMSNYFGKRKLSEADTNTSKEQVLQVKEEQQSSQSSQSSIRYDINGEKEIKNSQNRTYAGETDLFKRYNNWIKTIVILFSASLCPDKYHLSVLDLGCGKGGDLFKFSMLSPTAKTGLYIGIDTSSSSIECCASRYRTTGFKYRSLFSVASMSDVNLLENILEDSEKKFLCNVKFNLVSCQFAIHYCFSSVDLANRAFHNAGGRLRKDGIFVATTPDYNAIKKAIENTVGESYEEVKISFGDAVLTIPRETVQSVLENNPQFGMRYHFSLNDLVCGDEFLVPPQLVETLCSNHGFELIKDYSPNFSSFSDFISGTDLSTRALDLAKTTYNILQGESSPAILPLYRVLMFRKISEIENSSEEWHCPVAIYEKNEVVRNFM